ncbi:hypothetical protein HSBGL_1586 [Halapricum desulfuricans]|uniref:Uncharacterized protein n=1 Tax=Halapricum desulfuricans TaxID=2841257 RepID=A0A897NM55_9EURY|nr:hypothetical protein [Halapricum desulfuricans]QSG12003.1 hypothetical protein HSBGL_1586 [Halapricum desulfuricans]
MSRIKTAALVVAALIGVAGVAAATGAVGTGADASAQADETTSTLTNVDATATLDNDTLEVTVTTNGSPAENVSVTYDDQTQLTDENGTVLFNLSEDGGDEVEFELEKGGFEGELEYVLGDGPLTLVEEEYEYDIEGAEDEHDEGDEAEEDEEIEDTEAEEEAEENELDDEDDS